MTTEIKDWVSESSYHSDPSLSPFMEIPITTKQTDAYLSELIVQRDYREDLICNIATGFFWPHSYNIIAQYYKGSYDDYQKERQAFLDHLDIAKTRTTEENIKLAGFPKRERVPRAKKPFHPKIKPERGKRTVLAN